MKLFTKLYQKMLDWSSHRYAPYYLTGVSVAESTVLPIPPDIMLAAMTLAKPKSSWRFALLTTLGSVFGGVIGYAIGYFAYPYAELYIAFLGYEDLFKQLLQWFSDYGFWIIFLAGFSPIPYKIFTIGAGFMQVNLLTFIIASILSRGLRFYLVAGLIRLGGEKLKDKLHRYVEWLGWSFVIISVLVYLYIYYTNHA